MLGKYAQKIQFIELIGAPEHCPPLSRCASQAKNAQCPVYLVCLQNRDTPPLNKTRSNINDGKLQERNHSNSFDVISFL